MGTIRSAEGGFASLRLGVEVLPKLAPSSGRDWGGPRGVHHLGRQEVVRPSPRRGLRPTRARAATPSERPPDRCQRCRETSQSAPEGTRTPNLLIRSQVLYPLSYGRSALPPGKSTGSGQTVRADRSAEAPGFEPGMGFRPKPH